ncbi:MAG: LysR substrate-binding domain-containing protein [Verrucomicrobiales bacterium]
MIVHLAALGFGMGLVPGRALTTFPRRHRLRLLPLPAPFSRDLVVVTRGQSASSQVRDFVASILFS